MNDEEKKARDAELDAFWDIDALIPKKKVPYHTCDTSAAEIVLEPMQPTNETERREERIPPAEEPRRHFIPPHTAAELTPAPPDLEYIPENPLVRRVRLYRWRSDYRYYESFVRDAVRLYAVKGGVCARVPFFSYVPQYSQMSRPQLEWYLYWRDRLRHGEMLDTDYSYLLLYVYEIINLSDRIKPETAQDALCKVWVHYRTLYHQLDSYLPEWICDHCLIHQLPPPEICTGELLPAVMQHCVLKEFYVPGGREAGYVQALLAFCSNYDHRKSKFCTEENRTLFDTAVIGGLREVIRSMSTDGRLFSSAGMDDSKLMRDAYTGALCSYRIKRKIEVEYCSFSRSHELRYLITDVVKYTENRIRAVLGVRSRLSVYALPTAVREVLDRFLDATLPARKTVPKTEQEAPAEYEKFYDLPNTELSITGAAEIERASWETTQRLVEAFEEPEPPIPSMPQISKSVPESAPNTDDPLAPYRRFLRAALDGEWEAQVHFAQQAGKPIEVVADDINALAADLFGDILLEETENGFAVIEDYRELIEEKERN